MQLVCTACLRGSVKGQSSWRNFCRSVGFKGLWVLTSSESIQISFDMSFDMSLTLSHTRHLNLPSFPCWGPYFLVIASQWTKCRQFQAFTVTKMKTRRWPVLFKRRPAWGFAWHRGALLSTSVRQSLADLKMSWKTVEFGDGWCWPGSVVYSSGNMYVAIFDCRGLVFSWEKLQNFMLLFYSLGRCLATVPKF